MWGCLAASLQLQSLATGVRENYATLKTVLREKFVPKEQVELHKKLLDLASSMRKLISQAYPEAVPVLQDSLTKDQFIDALEDQEIQMKL